MSSRAKIFVTGTRGIPDIQGGVETHCEQLFPRMAAMDRYTVTLARRSCYVSTPLKQYKGVSLVDIYAPRRKSVEAIIHTFLAVIKARSRGASIVHIHAIGPAIMVPFAKLLGLKVVMTHHGPDYDRKKWGRLAKGVLRLGERWGVKYSDKVIVISSVINNIITSNYNRTDAHLIFNGVETPVKSKNNDYILSQGLTPGKYIVTLGRFVAEKGFHDLIEAYTLSNARAKGYRLVIAGDADHEDEYSAGLKSLAREHDVTLTGFIKGERLNQLMSHASLFVLPSYHEGLPIALLEAMSYNLDVIASDIPANMIAELDDVSDHFPVGDVQTLAKKIDGKIESGLQPREYDLSRYNWDNIALQTAEVYQDLLKK